MSINDLKFKYLNNQVGDSVMRADTGWASYIDTQYPDSGTAFTLSANTDTILPNNAGSVIDFQKPIGVDSFYNGGNQLISGQSGDGIDLMAYLTAVPTVNNQWLDIWIDILGIGEVYRETKSFPRGSGQERGIVYSLSSLYNLGTWESNGARLMVRSNATLSLYGINYNIDRSHKSV